MTEKMIIDAYCRIRTIDHVIPDAVLDFMKDCAIEKIQQLETNARSKSSQLGFGDILDCPFEFTSRCTLGRCDCKPKTFDSNS